MLLESRNREETKRPTRHSQLYRTRRRRTASRQQTRSHTERPTTAFQQSLQQAHREKLMTQRGNDALVPTIEQGAHILRVTGRRYRVPITHESTRKRRNGPLLRGVSVERSPMTGEYSRRTTSCRRNGQPTSLLESTDTMPEDQTIFKNLC